MDGVNRAAAERPRSFLRNPQDAAAGLFLTAVAAFALWQSSDLELGTLRSMGAGMLPTSLAALVGALGLLIIALAFVHDGPALERWRLRGPIFILGSVVIFALLIRTTGLAIAGPVSMLIGCFATDEVRWKEAVIFAVAMTAFCIVLFKVVLGLPIPVLTLG
jgi:putative tricarboxylic transport membrane protein